jgi:L-arabinose isomerase
MKIFENYEVWFVTGSQHLYGPEVLKKVASDAQVIAKSLSESANIPVNIVFKQVLTTPDEITNFFIEANSKNNCIGIITWCHTFSPSKMWINGLKILQKPLLHFHTQFNRDLPWGEIDMDFMNLNQSAHGDREHGFIMSRMRINRKVVVGHWEDEDVKQKIAIWCRAAMGWNEIQHLKLARFGDNMREVAVTEGDKVAAQIQLGLSVNGYGVGDLVDVINGISDSQVNALTEEYFKQYQIADDCKKGGRYYENVRYQAKVELGLRKFLENGGFKAFTTTFEDLHGLQQLPGLACQRLMADGYGFGAEGDWKHAAMVRVFKVMGKGLKGGSSFMEDYTYHLHPSGMRILGAHMLEVCPTIGDGKTSLQVHPLDIGGKLDPARLVFNVPAGEASCTSLIDMGNRFRLIVNAVNCVEPEQNLPKLPVARALWTPQPDLKTAAAAWIYAGGAHHTVFSQSVPVECIEDFCNIAGIEFLLIDKNTCLTQFRNELRWNDLYYHLSNALKNL